VLKESEGKDGNMPTFGVAFTVFVAEVLGRLVDTEAKLMERLAIVAFSQSPE